jgi:uncharacterized protein YqjF (DUF2071 family)
MHPSLRQTDHRPWPLPQGPWTWRQQWCDLLFAQAMPVAAVRALVPPVLEIRSSTAPRGWESSRSHAWGDGVRCGLPWVSAFAELNLASTSCTRAAWCLVLSLDAANSLAVWAARTFFHLPSPRRHDRETHGERIVYRSAGVIRWDRRVRGCAGPPRRCIERRQVRWSIF